MTRPATPTRPSKGASGREPTRSDGGAGADARRREESRLPYLQRRHEWVPRLAGLLTLLAGLLDVGSALTPALVHRVHELRRVLPGSVAADVSHNATAATLVFGVLLLLLARGIRRRKRRAWRAVVVLLAASVVGHVVKGLDIEEAVVSFVLLVWMVVFRRDFYAKGDPTTRWRAVWYGLGLAAGSVVLGLILLAVRPQEIVPPHPFSAELSQVVHGLVGLDGPLQFHRDSQADLVGRVLGGLGLLVIGVTAYLALRPPEPRPRLTPEDQARMRALLSGPHGRRDSLGYFALRADKSVVWSPTGKSCIAYRVLSGVMLASGDPLGDPEAWPGAIKEFLREADEHAWVPAVIGCSEAGGTAYTRMGLGALELGDEAIVELAEFTLEGRAMRNVRQAVGRVERAGYTATVRRVGDIPAEERAEMRAAADTWRGEAVERGFSMALSRFGAPGDDNCVVVAARDPEGRLRGLLHFVPWGLDGLSLDLMRRDRQAENGINEYLIVTTLREAGTLGVNRVSLNFATFRSVIERGERLGAGPIVRGWRNVLVFVSRWFQIDSLYRFNAKFRPIWEPRFVCYPSARAIPRIALAMLEAEAFLVWPRPRLPWRRQQPAPVPAAAEPQMRP